MAFLIDFKLFFFVDLYPWYYNEIMSQNDHTFFDSSLTRFFKFVTCIVGDHSKERIINHYLSPRMIKGNVYLIWSKDADVNRKKRRLAFIIPTTANWLFFKWAVNFFNWIESMGTVLKVCRDNVFLSLKIFFFFVLNQHESGLHRLLFVSF